MEYGHTTGHHVVRSPLSSSLHHHHRVKHRSRLSLVMMMISVKHCSWRNAAVQFKKVSMETEAPTNGVSQWEHGGLYLTRAQQQPSVAELHLWLLQA